MNRLVRTLVFAAACCVALGPTSAQGRKMSTFLMTSGYHLDIYPWSDSDVDAACAGMSSLISEIEIISECGDEGACVSIRRSAPVVAWGSEGDGHDVVDTKAELDMLLQSGPEWKIVASIRIGNRDYYGQTYPGIRSTVVTEDSPDDSWAHEFGHQKGLDENLTCPTLIMCTDTLGIVCAGTRVEVDPITERAAFEAAPDDTTDTCDITGEASLEGLTATVEPDGVHIRFRTLWEVHSQGFEVRRVNSAGDSVLYSLGSAAWQPDANLKAYEADGTPESWCSRSVPALLA